MKKVQRERSREPLNTSGVRGSSPAITGGQAKISSMEVQTKNTTGSIKMPQPSPTKLNQSSIEEMMAQHNQTAYMLKNISQPQMQIDSGRQVQKIQIHMKNNRFHNRKASGPAINQAGSNLIKQQQALLKNQQIVQDRSLYDSAILTQPNDVQLLEQQQALYQSALGVSQAPGQVQIQRQTQRDQSAGNSGQNRPSSKGHGRKEKQPGQFGRTFFHPQGEGSQMDASLIEQSSQPNLNSTATNLAQLYMINQAPGHYRAATQIEMNNVLQQDHITGQRSTMPSSGNFNRQQQFLENSDRMFNEGSTKHTKSKSMNKFSQPELSRYNHSIERIANISQLGASASIVGISGKEKRQNYSLGPQQQAQLKQSLIQTKGMSGGKQIDGIFADSAYTLQQKPQSLQNRKATVKANQQFVKKALGGMPFTNASSLSTTQPLRFQNQAAGISNYNTTGLQSTQSASGMNSTTNPNAHLLNYDSQPSLANQSSIPLITKNTIEDTNSLQHNFNNSQVLDRLLLQQTQPIPQPAALGSSKKRSAKGQHPSLTNASAAIFVKNKNTVAAEFQQNSASATQAFYPQDRNLQNLQLQQYKNKTAYAGIATQPIDLQNASNQAFIASSGVISSKNQTTSLEKANNYYLKQQLAQSKSKQRGTSQDPQPHLLDSNQSQHRKNHSVVIQRIHQAPKAQNAVLGVPGDMSPSRVERVMSRGSNKGLKLGNSSQLNFMETRKVAQAQHGHHNSVLIGNNVPGQKGIIDGRTSVQLDYTKAQTGQKSKTRAHRASSNSMERANKAQPGAMTPSINRTSLNAQQVISSKAKGGFIEEQQYPSVNPTKLMVQDGGTGASLKRVFIQQESSNASAADSLSNYGTQPLFDTSGYASQVPGGQSYHLPLKQMNSQAVSQQKRLAIQKANQKKTGLSNNTTSQATGSSNMSDGPSDQVSKRTTGRISSMSKDNGDPSLDVVVVGQLNPRQVARQRTEEKPPRVTGDYGETPLPAKSQQVTYSINITQEALRIGKLPTEKVAANMAKGLYNKNGSLKTSNNKAPSPRVCEMMQVREKLKESFRLKETAPETNTEFYRAGKMLGRGAFGKVNLGMHKLTRKLVAIKSINKEYLSEEKQRTKIMHEVGILLRLRHTSVVKLYETFETRRHILLVMELCAGGDLLNFVRKRKKMDENLAKVLFKQIIEGIGYIHSKSILHRDIKLDNILLDGKGNVKIADFGVSKMVKKGEMMYEQSGTPAYIAPEIIKDKGYKGFKADMWSAGVVLYALLTGTVPFKANNMKDLHQQILTAKYTMKEEISAEAQSLIRGLLTIEPKKRLGVNDVLKHKWLAGVEFLSTDIFNDEEKEVIRSEFTYNDPSRFNRNEKVKLEEEPWDCFTELNLDSMNQTLRNASEKSLILAPFNSTMSDLDAFMKSLLSMAPMEIKKDKLKFAARCRDQDRQYEINNNAELDNGVYHKFVYSSRDSRGAKEDKNQGRDQEEALLSRNASKRQLQSPLSDSEDLSKPAKKNQGKNADINAEKEALKQDLLKMKGKVSQPPSVPYHGGSSDDEDFALAQTNGSNFQIQLDDDRVQTLANLGYPVDYVKYAVLENEANYCTTAYYLLVIDQNY